MRMGAEGFRRELQSVGF